MGRSVLVVDDQMIVRTIVSQFLVKEGYTVTSVADEQQALRALTEHQPTIVIADAEVLDTDGGVLAQCLAAQANSLRVIVMTHSIATGPLPDAACLTKPFDIVHLLDTVGDMMLAPANAVGD